MEVYLNEVHDLSTVLFSLYVKLGSTDTKRANKQNDHSSYCETWEKSPNLSEFQYSHL